MSSVRSIGAGIVCLALVTSFAMLVLMDLVKLEASGID